MAFDGLTGFEPVRDAFIIRFLPDTGIRVGEAAALLLSDWDQERKLVTVRATVQGEQSRTVTWGAETEHALRRYLHARDRLGIEGAHLIVSRAGQPLSGDRISRIFANAGQRVHLPYRSGGHRARHTLGRNATLAGQPVHVVAALLGHKTLAMAQHYGRLWDSDRLAIQAQISPVDHASPERGRRGRGPSTDRSGPDPFASRGSPP